MSPTPPPASVESLFDVVNHLAADNREGARRELQRLLDGVDPRRDATAVRYYVFGAALARRLSEDAQEEANLYLSDYEVPQIELFNLLARRVPMVGLSTRLANAAIASFVAGRDEACLLDVGMGTGRQFAALLDTLEEENALPGRLHVVGIEPMGWALERAEADLTARAARLGVDLTFQGIPAVAEALDREAWERIAEACDAPVVNASFALHHIGDVEGSDARDDVLGRLRWLEPSALILAEPHADHLEPDLVQRFRNCWSHFGSVFAVLDDLPLEPRDRDALKVCFFGREVADILGNPEGERSERHERASSWLARLDRTGFDTAARFPVDDAADDWIDAVDRDGWVSLSFRDETIVALLCAVPREGARRSDAEAFGATAATARTRPAGRARELDADAYLAALLLVARSDGVVREGERTFVEVQAGVLGRDPASLWSLPDLESLVEARPDMTCDTRDAIVRDAVFLARVDGAYGPEERAEIVRVAGLLGLDGDDVERIEGLVSHQVGPVADAPSWFRELWYVGRK